eukprot:TRINITY_DN12955_c0_g1_i1.p1 TRINITY_DN12955_c0_g1~~TRINITY_DN12955_c0_g1_i1.p1  ORF type:complete len:242 (+),score=27.11 TRINITY_DN12955_c0_g1_i1:132-857(+)
MVDTCADQLQPHVDYYLWYVAALREVSPSEGLEQCASELARLYPNTPSSDAVAPPAWLPSGPHPLQEYVRFFNEDLNEVVAGIYGTFKRQPHAFGCLLRLGACVQLRGYVDQQGDYTDFFPELVQAHQLLPPASDPHAVHSTGTSMLFASIFNFQFEHAQILIELGACCGPDPIWRVNVLQFLKLCHIRHRRGYAHEWHEADLPADWNSCVTPDQLDYGCDKCERLLQFQTWCQQRGMTWL